MSTCYPSLVAYAEYRLQTVQPKTNFSLNTCAICAFFIESDRESIERGESEGMTCSKGP